MDINNFWPFNSETWGTVTDAIIAIVSAITAIFLYKTFKSQIAVQKMQQSLTDIENERYRIQYKPTFEIIPIEIKQIASTDQLTKSLINFKLKLKNNDAKTVEVIAHIGTAEIEQITLAQKGIGMPMPIDNLYCPSEFSLYFQVSTLSVLYNSEGGYFFFYLKFSDTLGNIYKQEFTVMFLKTTFQNFSQRHPERILSH